MATDEQQKLIDRIAQVLQEEPDIDAAWLAGSLGKSGGDAFSDVDVLVLCTGGKAGEVSKALQQGVAKIATPVLVNSLFGGRVINTVTDDWQRFDLALVEAAQLSLYNSALLKPLFNKGSFAPPIKAKTPHKTSPDTLLAAINEFYRILGLMPVVMGREEYVLGPSGVELLRRMTIDLMLEENGIAQQERGGALHLNRLLTPEQRVALCSVPAVASNRDSIIAANLALAVIFFPLARRLAVLAGVAWPDALEDATRRHLEKSLAIRL